MNKDDDRTKRKGVYLVTTFGAVFVIALVAIVSGMFGNGNKKNPGKIDLNATKAPEQSGEAVPGPGELSAELPNEGKLVTDQPSEVPEGTADIARHPENQINPPEDKQKGNEIKEENASNIDSEQLAQTEPELQEPNTAVLNPESILSTLHFSGEKGMLWPVTGAVVMNFSPDHAIYHKTLDSYRTSNYVMLAGNVGSHVSAAAEGVVAEVSQNEKTGGTVSILVSEEYEIVYGLLDNICVKPGDVVKEGETIATIAEPTRYFIEEGSGVYLKVLHNGEEVNPMLFLK